MFDPFAYLNSLLSVFSKLKQGVRDYRDPFRAQAARLLEALSAHDLEPNVAVSLMPDTLKKSIDDLSSLAHADGLKKHLHHVSPWVEDLLGLNPQWVLTGRELPHTVLSSAPANLLDLYSYLKSLNTGDAGDPHASLYVFKGDSAPIDKSTGFFVIVLEVEVFDSASIQVSKYFYLSEHAFFEHGPCVDYLLQVLAIAYSLDIVIWGRVLKQPNLLKLVRGQGFITDYFADAAKNKTWYPDDALWLSKPISGDPEWKEQVQLRVKKLLEQKGLSDVLQKIQSSGLPTAL